MTTYDPWYRPRRDYGAPDDSKTDRAEKPTFIIAATGLILVLLLLFSTAYFWSKTKRLEALVFESDREINSFMTDLSKVNDTVDYYRGRAKAFEDESEELKRLIARWSLQKYEWRNY